MNEIIKYWEVNDDLLARFNEIRDNDQRKIKKGFKQWLKYIRTWKN